MSEPTVPQGSSRYIAAMPLVELYESKHNPRKHFDAAALKELEQSIREKGVLTPLLARPNGKGHELAAGHRRFRAAKAAGLEAVPVVVRDMTDAELLEILVVENSQREDVHPLEEAAGYQALVKSAGYDVARIAARIGRSAEYVYGRLKLLNLIPEAQRLFLAGKFEAGHAVLLARLSPKDQERAIDPEGPYNRDRNLFRESHAPLFDETEDEDGTREEKAEKRDPYARLLPVSVREFARWIQHEVRATPEAVDGFLFPKTQAVLEEHAGDKREPILITREYRASDSVRNASEGGRIYGTQSWKRADGREKSKTCDWSRVGFVTCGPGQGEAIVVCVNKDKCAVHYGAEIKARKTRQRETQRAIEKGEDPRAAETKARERQAEEERRREAERARWEKAIPLIVAAVAGRVRTASIGILGAILLEELHVRGSERAEKLMPRGKTADSLLRHVAFAVTDSRIEELYNPRDIDEILAPFSLTAKTFLAEVAAEEKKLHTSAKPASGTCRKCGCTEDKACAGGCSWMDAKKTCCSRCFPNYGKGKAAKKAATKKARK